MNILIIEDDLFLWKKIKEIFEKKVLSNRIKVISTLDSFLNEFSLIDSYDIVLLDIILWINKLKNWIDILKIIRKKNNKIPIIIISSFNEFHRLEEAFENWANDYIIKPFRLKELEIRILKWFKQHFCWIFFTSSNIIEYEHLVYDIIKNEFFYDNKVIKLSKKNKYLLSVFICYKEQLLKEKFLIDKIWWDVFFIIERNLRVNVMRLKESLKEHWIQDWIQNIRWEWYIFQKK